MKLREYLIENIKINFASQKDIAPSEKILGKAKVQYKVDGTEITMGLKRSSLLASAILDKLKEVGHFTEK